MTGLSELLLVSNGNVTAIVARLVEDGFVSRTRDKSDRRVLRVRLTAKGRRDFRGFAAAHEAWIDRLLGDLADGEISQLLGGLGRVKASIERSGL
jgi:DNA-binding MarR family transcriptional regulator